MGVKTASSGFFTSRAGPGPGQYTHNSIFHRVTGAASFGRAQKFDRRRASAEEGASPGPGQYKANFNATLSTLPKYIFGSTKREQRTFYDSPNKNNPGPGEYNYTLQIGKGSLSSSMTPRRPDTAPQAGLISPGPAAYKTFVNTIMKQEPQYKIGSSLRKDLTLPEQLKTPGPQAYDISKTQDIKQRKQPQVVFGSS
jgi:hypothetical protein